MPGKRPHRRLLIVSGTAALAVAAMAPARAQPAAFPPASNRPIASFAPAGAMLLLSGPAVMAQPVVERLNQPMRAALTAPAMRARQAERRGRPDDPPAEAFTRYVATEVAHWAPIVPASGATPD